MAYMQINQINCWINFFRWVPRCMMMCIKELKWLDIAFLETFFFLYLYFFLTRRYWFSLMKVILQYTYPHFGWYLAVNVCPACDIYSQYLKNFKGDTTLTSLICFFMVLKIIGILFLCTFRRGLSRVDHPTSTLEIVDHPSLPREFSQKIVEAISKYVYGFGHQSSVVFFIIQQLLAVWSFET